ncbi:hypothetical protein X949_5980 [Burkholderia pseudomallei MSHR5609]|nr:hypothetical protein X949_5980 [Burkholderia pseudomallei MSHR5609]
MPDFQNGTASASRNANCASVGWASHWIPCRTRLTSEVSARSGARLAVCRSDMAVRLRNGWR